MKSLPIRPIPSDNSQKHPPVPSEILPQHPFSLGIIAPKGSGKTTLIGNLIHMYKNYFHAIVVFSPTINNDEKWVWIQKQKVLRKNTELENFVKEGSKKRKRENAEPNNGDTGNPKDFVLHEDEDWNGCIMKDHVYSNYSKDDLKQIMDEQQKLTNYISKNGGCQVMKNRILFVFDDLVGSNLFSSEKQNPFKILNSNMRHNNASILMVSQAYKEIPKTIRTNFSGFIIFEIASNNEKAVIMQEYGMGLEKKQWERVYKYCTEEPFSFLYYNTGNPKDKRIMKCFSEFINTSY